MIDLKVRPRVVFLRSIPVLGERIFAEECLRPARGRGRVFITTHVLHLHLRSILQRFRQVIANYEKHRRGAVLPASYEVIYGHAWKAAPRRMADGRPVIELRRRT